MGLRKLITKNDKVKCHTGEEQLSTTGNGFVLVALMVRLVLLLFVGWLWGLVLGFT